MSNVSKILKLELFLLFLLTVISFIAFYYQNMLPDNYLAISSESGQFGYFAYYLSSLVAFVGYYTGPWVFIPFVLFSLFYTFQFSHREMIFDTVNFLSLTLGSLLLVGYFFPDFTGTGVSYLIRKLLNPHSVLALGLAFMIVFFAGSFRSSFKEVIIGIFVFLGKLPKRVWWALAFFNPLFWYEKFRVLKIKFKAFIELDIPSLLKRGRSVAPLKESLVGKTEFVNRLELPEPGLKKSSNPFDKNKKVIKKNKREKVQEVDFKQINYHNFIGSLTSKSSASKNISPDSTYFEDIVERIEAKLAEFKIDGNIINILKGPVVDTFELELGSGVKVSKVLNHEADLSLALYGAPIRIVYPMIGKTTMGIEVPRDPREFIYLDEVLQSDSFRSSQYKLPIAMGKNAFGEIFVVDLASMPHMLVAGATGAGKSVFVNSLLVSLLVKKSPSQMKLILIDPKQLELAVYHRLPHLMMPVITGAKEASLALLWTCQEMERRYSILKDFGVRNIESFNEKLERATPDKLAQIHSYYENEPEGHYELPYLVVIVDEFADLMLTKVRQEIEGNISRLAAKARAAGIHLVLATQRPSVDVITGVIKSNFPTRVAFKVTSQQDSRTILTTIGSEKLLGKGDGLFRNGTENLRFHSSYVDEEEIEALMDKLSPMPQQFHQGAVEFLESGEGLEVDESSYGSSYVFSMADGSVGKLDEELFKQAVRVVVEHRTASASMLQRRLRIGYNRAALLVEQMEVQGIVGPAQGSKRREVLIGSEDI